MLGRMLVFMWFLGHINGGPTIRTAQEPYRFRSSYGMKPPSVGSRSFRTELWALWAEEYV